MRWEAYNEHPTIAEKSVIASRQGKYDGGDGDTLMAEYKEMHLLVPSLTSPHLETGKWQ